MRRRLTKNIVTKSKRLKRSSKRTINLNKKQKLKQRRETKVTNLSQRHKLSKRIISKKKMGWKLRAKMKIRNHLKSLSLKMNRRKSRLR